MNSFKNLRIVLPLIMVLIVVVLVALKPEKYQRLSYSNSIDLTDAKISQTNIKFNAGTLNLSTHSRSSIALNAEYTRESWKPEMILDKQAGEVIIYQPDEKSTNMKDEDQNDWQILFPKNLSTNIGLTIGAGEASVDLSGSKLRSLVLDAGAGEFNINLANTSLSRLEVNAGVGELNLDLSGKQEQNLDVSINGGIGSIKLVLPQDTGVRVKVSGLGGIDVNDLIKKDGYYVNELYGQTTQSIELEINGGLGSLELRLR